MILSVEVCCQQYIVDIVDKVNDLKRKTLKHFQTYVFCMMQIAFRCILHNKSDLFTLIQNIADIHVNISTGL